MFFFSYFAPECNKVQQQSQTIALARGALKKETRYILPRFIQCRKIHDKIIILHTIFISQPTNCIVTGA